MQTQKQKKQQQQAAELEGRGSSTSEARHERIAQSAWFKAEARHFAPGHELEDWLAAEREVDATGAEAKAS